MVTWYTSDLHFGDPKVLDKHDRPFNSLEEHDAFLILSWNSTVTSGDRVFILGDVLGPDTDASILASLNGEINLVPGNWDEGRLEEIRPYVRAIWPYAKGGFLRMHDYDAIPAIFSHEALTVMQMGAFSEKFEEDFLLNIHGDVHNDHLVREDGEYCWINVGVDFWDYAPVSSETLWEMAEDCIGA